MTTGNPFSFNEVVSIAGGEIESQLQRNRREYLDVLGGKSILNLACT